MAEQVYIRDIAAHVGETVTLKGWLYNKTDKGRLQFLLVRDGTGIIQTVVFRQEVSSEVFEGARTRARRASRAAMSWASRISRSTSWRKSIPSRPRSTAWAFSWKIATSGCARRNRTPSC